MKDRQIRREGRQSAFPHATQWDADQLNPWKGRYAGSFDAARKAEVWQEAFLTASKEATDRALQESEIENPG